MVGGDVFLSIGRSTALENAVKLIHSYTGRGVLFISGCYYGRTCMASQVGGRELCYSCDSFEVIEPKFLEIEKYMERYRAIMGGVVVQPYISGEEIEGMFLRGINESCRDNGMLFVDDETESGDPENWKNDEMDPDMLLLGSSIVYDMFPVEALVVRSALKVDLKEEELHPEIFEIVEDALFSTKERSRK